MIFKKGMTPWNKGLTKETDSRLLQAGLKASKSKKGKPAHNKGAKYPQLLGANNPSWKGDKIGYSGLHDWLERELGKAHECVNPGCIYPRKDYDGRLMVTPHYQWANISHEYKREISDWMQICASCHGTYDKQFKGKPHRFSNVIGKKRSLRNK